MSRTSFTIPLLILCLLSIKPLHAQVDGTSGDSALTLEAVIDIALRENPSLKGRWNDWRSAESRISQESAFDDPVLGIAAVNLPSDTFVFDETPMTGLQFSLRQKIPFPGKLGVKKRHAREMSHVSKEVYEERKVELIAKIRTVFYRLASLDQETSVTEDNKRLLQKLVDIAETKYSVGNGLQQDVLKAHVALSKTGERLISLAGTRATLAAELNTLLNRSPEESLGKPAPITQKPLALSPEQLQDLALSSRPLLKGMAHQVRGAAFLRDLARKGYWPDFVVGLDYRLREKVLGDPVEGQDFFSASVSVKLPLFFYKKQSNEIRARQAQLASAESQLEDTRNQVLWEVASLFYQVKTIEERIRLYETDILEQAAQALASATTGYEVDQADILSVLDGQQTLYEYQITYIRLISEHEELRAKLEAAVGAAL